MLRGSLGQISNRATWTESGELVDDDTGELINLTGYKLEIEVETAKGSRVLYGSDVGGQITYPTSTSFQFTFSASQMGRLDAGTYNVGLLITDDVTAEVTQAFIGSVAVIDGIVGA